MGLTYEEILEVHKRQRQVFIGFATVIVTIMASGCVMAGVMETIWLCFTMGVFSLGYWSARAQIKEKLGAYKAVDHTPFLFAAPASVPRSKVFRMSMTAYPFFIFTAGYVTLVIKEVPLWHTVLTLASVCGGMGVLWLFSRRYKTCSGLVYEEGVQYGRWRIPFGQVKKHQFVPLKNNRYSVELNTGYLYVRVMVDESQKAVLEKLLTGKVD